MSLTIYVSLSVIPRTIKSSLMSCASKMATFDSFEIVKTIDQSTKDIVSGFIRDTQLLSTNNSYFIIPSLVHHWCLLYYYFPEFFTASCDRIELNESKTIATCIKADDGQGIFGNVIIDESSINMIYVWKIRVIRLKDVEFDVEIGITDKNKYKLIDEDAGTHYYFAPDGTIRRLKDFGDDGRRMTWYERIGSDTYTDGDIIELELNVANRTLSCGVNGKASMDISDIEFDNGAQYRLTILMPSKYDKVELLHFKSKGSNN